MSFGHVLPLCSNQINPVDLCLNWLFLYLFGAGRSIASESKQININKNSAALLVLFASVL